MTRTNIKYTAWVVAGTVTVLGWMHVNFVTAEQHAQRTVVVDARYDLSQLQRWEQKESNLARAQRARQLTDIEQEELRRTRRNIRMYEGRLRGSGAAMGNNGD